jgi:cell wall assembly regulator SMI1
MVFTLNPGVSADALDTVMQALNLELPEDYRQFLRASNGGEGFLGPNYVMLWKAEQLDALNMGYNVACSAPGLLLFGSDGGGEAYAFDTRTTPWAVVQVPFVGMDDPDVAISLGRNFTEFLQTMSH